MLAIVVAPCCGIQAQQCQCCCILLSRRKASNLHRQGGIVASKQRRLCAVVRSSADKDLDVSVFRFTLGIPGFDESQLPRILGLLLGNLILLNHILSTHIAPAQIRSEGVGLLLAIAAVFLPYLRKLELDELSSRAGSLPANLTQVFAMAEWLDDDQKQELAWGSYALIRNTKTIAVIVWFDKQLVLARGCWNLPQQSSAAESLSCLEAKFQAASTWNDLQNNAFYIPSGAYESQGLSFVPEGVNAALAQPFANNRGGLLVVSDVPRAYNSNKDKTWVETIAEKISKSL